MGWVFTVMSYVAGYLAVLLEAICIGEPLTSYLDYCQAERYMQDPLDDTLYDRNEAFGLGSCASRLSTKAEMSIEFIKSSDAS
jgi:hypothetical protein